LENAGGHGDAKRVRDRLSRREPTACRPALQRKRILMGFVVKLDKSS
jgi:hypothetical protein